MMKRGTHPVGKKISTWMICFLAAVTLAGQGGGVVQSGPPTRARVVMVEDAQATSAYEPQPAVVQDMVNRAMLKLSGKDDIVQAWRTIVATQDVVGLKVYCAPGPTSGTRPAVVSAVVRGLLSAGLPPHNIIIWDKRLADLRAAGFDELAQHYDVRLAGSADSGYDEKAFYDKEIIGELGFGDLDFDKSGAKTGRKSHVSKLLTGDITKIITITPLLNHNVAGVTGNLYSLATGSVDNVGRFEAQAARLAEAVPEIYALPALSDHVALSITDALIGQYQGESTSLLHYSTAVNQVWISKDPVALDVLAIQELDREREARKMNAGHANAELYHNAWLLELGLDDPAKVQVEMVK
jgi:hypothetical protein